MNWQVKIQDPSGQVRRLILNDTKNPFSLGREESSAIFLNDFSLPKKVGHFWRENEKTQCSPFWFKLCGDEQNSIVCLGDLFIREAHIPAGIPLKIGDTILTLEETTVDKKDPPEFPAGVKPWLTCTSDGVNLLWSAKKAAQSPLSIYLEGETGTGKEVLARLMHAWGERCSGPFVPIHCGALPMSLAESELFGHVKGSFTGAISHRPGALIQAHGGTLFLDEVGDLPLEIQVKLLRFLEDGELRAVGSDHATHADVRIICATNQSLKKLVEEKKFRQDLFYRLATVSLNIPSLRSRPQDIELLAKQFVSCYKKTLSPKALFRLKNYPWPGNVRELRHVIERTCALSASFEEIFFVLTKGIVQKLQKFWVWRGVHCLKC
ncbi:MAG: sigma-54-dependent Fis family transcriptional regulator [Deltaproteobacteria bacterium]|nr:sigma-54-dependent Fis family transcriptional regulator [Deltaproteobacteria bacterium]